MERKECPACGKRVAACLWSLWSHAEQTGCLEKLPLKLRREIDALPRARPRIEERPSCPGCGKSLANLDNALKAHAWEKRACRAAIPTSMADEIIFEERLAEERDRERQTCPGCGKSLANLGEALKAHAWSRPQCRPHIPACMAADIRIEEKELQRDSAAMPHADPRAAHRCPLCAPSAAFSTLSAFVLHLENHHSINADVTRLLPVLRDLS